MSESKLRGKSERKDGSRSSSNVNLSAPKPTEIPPDILFKMSKKIAQLTKVIYYLNTKNEDHGLEIQNLVDSYELEISEVIHDGEKAINEYRLKLEESQLKLKAQEDVIMSYLENSKKQEDEIKALRQTEDQLRHDLMRLERETAKKSVPVQKPSETPAPVQPVAPSSDGINELKKEHEETIANLTSQYEQRIQSLKLECSSEVEDLKSDHSKKLRALNEDRQKTEETLKRTLETTKAKLEDDTNKFQTEIRRLSTTVDEQEKEFKSQFTGLEKRLRSALEEEQRKVSERDTIISEIKGQTTRKDERLQELEADTVKKAKTIKELLDQVSQLSFDNESFKDQLSALSQKANQLEIQNTEFSFEISQKTQQLKETESACMQALDESQKLNAEVSRLSGELSNSLSALQDLTEKINSMDVAHDTLQRDVSERDRMLVEAEEKYHELERKNAHDIEDALSRLKETMEMAKQEAISKLTAELEQRKIDAIHEKSMELKELTEKLERANQEFDLKTQQIKEAFDLEKHGLTSKIAALNETNGLIESKLQNTLVTLEERMAEISRHLLTIQHLTSTVKTLEVDKADLFQKMVHVDRQIRAEMLEKFQKEKTDFEAVIREQHQADIENLKEILRANHEQDTQIALQKIKTYYTDEIDKIRTENQEKVEGFLAETSEKEIAIAQLSREKEELEQALTEAKQKYDQNLKEAEQQGAKTLVQEKEKWEAETQSRESQLKAASSLALSNAEKKFAAAHAELEYSHKKQLDELRSFHNISALAAKKEAESQRQTEMTRLKNAYADQMMLFAQEREKILSDLEGKLLSEKLDEIQKLTESFNSTIDEKDELIEDLQRNISQKQEQIDELKERIVQLEGQLTEARRNLDNTIEMMRQHDINARKRLEEQTNQFEAHFKREMEFVRAEHVRELQTMLQDFEKAKAYLKKQIANQTKMLQEAEVKYINREPRDVDLQKIVELEQAVSDEKRRAESILDELKYYKLEMNNREANFNKIFNKAPLVGLMQPATLTQKKGKSKDRIDLMGSSQRLPPLFSVPSSSGTPPEFATVSG